MPLSPYSEAVAKAIGQYLAAYSFTRRGLVCRRQPLRGVYHLVGIESTQYAVGQNIEVTCNVGVYVEQVHAILWGRSRRPSTILIDWLPGCKLYKLCDPSEVSETWWRVADPAVAQACVDDMTEKLAKHALPLLDRCSTFRGVYEVATGNPLFEPNQPAQWLYLAILAHIAGDAQRAESILDSMGADKRLSNWGKKVLEVRQKLSALT